MQQQGEILPRKLRSHSKTDKKGELGQQGQSPSQTQEQQPEQMAKVGDIQPQISQNEEVLLQQIPKTDEEWWQLLLKLQAEIRKTTLSEGEVKMLKSSLTMMNTNENLKVTESNRITALEDAMQDQDVKIRILTNIVIRQEETIGSIEERINFVRRAKLRQNIRISGIVEDPKEKAEVTKQKVEAFFKEELEMAEPPKIKSARRVGPQNNIQKRDREVVAKLARTEDKGDIYTSAKNLKGKQNPKKKLYFVNDDLDPEQAEERRKFRELQKENKAESDENKKSIKFVRSRIVVDNEIVVPKVAPPTATEVSRLTDEERMDIKATKLVPTDEHTEEMSDYSSFVQKVKTVDDVRKGYFKLRIRFGDATHISCGYRLSEPLGPFRQEGIDDKEIGAGRTLLNALKKKSVTNIAVYVVRWYGGKKLGNRRFQILEKLAEAAIGTYQFKIRDRSTRLQRSVSQTLLMSFTSQASVLTDVSFDTAEGERTEDGPQMQEKQEIV